LELCCRFCSICCDIVARTALNFCVIHWEKPAQSHCATVVLI
jgi:hypothetical protein